MSSGNTEGVVTDIQRFSIHDGPGIRTLVFLKGCPLVCPWCSNPETQKTERQILFYAFKCIGCGRCKEVCPRGAILEGDIRIDTDKCDLCGLCTEACPPGALQMSGSTMSVGELLDVVEKDRVFYEKSGGGVTFSGGEPLVQHEFLGEALASMREAGIHTAIETTGYARWPVLDGIREYVDLFLYDLKIMDPERHRKVTGVSNEVILQNLKKLTASGAGITVRVPVIPGYTSDEANLRSVFEFVSSLDSTPEVNILPYHKLGKSKYGYAGREYGLDEIEPPEDGEMQAIAALAESYDLTCTIGG